MALSTIVQLKANIPFVLDTPILDATLSGNVDSADLNVRDDLSKMVDWTELDALTYTPRVINRLAQYQACMVTIERNWINDETIIGEGVETENNAYKHWANKYNSLLNQVKSGEILILDDNEDEISLEVSRKPGVGRVI